MQLHDIKPELEEKNPSITFIGGLDFPCSRCDNIYSPRSHHNCFIIYSHYYCKCADCYEGDYSPFVHYFRRDIMTSSYNNEICSLCENDNHPNPEVYKS